MADKLFRMVLQVDNLDKAADFYAKLLGDPGRRIPRASRHYIDCGPVILALVDVTAGGEQLSWIVFRPKTFTARARARLLYDRGASVHFMFRIHGVTEYVS
jgi:hypothetical protein